MLDEHMRETHRIYKFSMCVLQYTQLRVIQNINANVTNVTVVHIYGMILQSI